MKIGVKVMPRQEVLDTQGRVVAQLLSEGGRRVQDCRVGKYIELEIEAESEAQAREKIREMAEFVLYNPLIESYEMEVIS